MNTPLAKYMSDRELNDSDFAILLGKDRTLVNRLRRGKVKPTLEVAALIEKHTAGAVAMQSWQDCSEPVLAGDARSAVHGADNTTAVQSASAGPDDEISPVAGSAAA